MRFDRPVFLFYFLPIVLGLYVSLTAIQWLLARAGVRRFPLRLLQNLVLLLASLFFYAWGEQEIVLVMLASIVANYVFGRMVESRRGTSGARVAVGLAVAFNLGLLVYWKYANFLWGSLAPLADLVGVDAGALPVLEPIHLPIGISFFSFQAMSYVVDVYRREGPVQKNPINFALYIALFPQLIAGPIVRYRDVARQLVDRVVDRAGFAYGIRRFVLGLSKKLLIADTVGRVADEVFAIGAGDLTAPVAWLGIACYTLQIYFDFSGYSDMAIGLGRMFGLRFLENFEYPYIARSITEFWRRWHISLSSWFRDYLYIPLGGNRLGRARTYGNLVTVFFLCGLWHGASWSFVVWGLYHGAFLVVERVGLKGLVDRLGPLRHAYMLLVVMVGWVFFRADTLGHALDYVGAMFGAGIGDGLVYHTGLYLNAEVWLALAVGVVGSAPLLPAIGRWRERLVRDGNQGLDLALEFCSVACVLLLLVASAMQMAAGTYSPFIYFRF